MNQILENQQINQTNLDLRQSNHSNAQNPAQQADWEGPLVIKIGSGYYKPVSNKNLNEIKIGSLIFVPVAKVAPKNVKSAISSSSEFKNSFAINIKNQTFIPLKSIPEIFAPKFRAKAFKIRNLVPKKLRKSKPIVIQIEEEFFKPNSNKSFNEKFIGGIEYVPVDKIPCGNQKEVIHPTKNIKNIVVIEIQSKSYIPYDSIPEKYQPYFRRPKPLDVIIKIENLYYGPTKISNLTKIKIGGVKYIPVSEATPSKKTFTIYPTKEFSEVAAIEKQNIQYIPQDSIPKIHQAVFLKPLRRAKVNPACIAPAVAINIDAKNFVPNLDENRVHIFFDGVLYIPVVNCPKSKNIKKIVSPSKNPLECSAITISKESLLPYACIPESFKDLYVKEYIKDVSDFKKPALLNPVVIKVDGKFYKPTTNKNLKYLKINGELYVPVDQSFDNQAENNHICPLKDLDSSVVIKDYQSYIPYNSIPLINRPAFEKLIKKLNNKLKPAIQTNGKPVRKAVKKQTGQKTVVLKKQPVLEINNGFYVPVKDKKYKKVVVDGIVYIPVRKISSSKKKSYKVSKANGTKIDTFNFGNDITYIPIKTVPKQLRKQFYNPIQKKKIPVKNQEPHIPVKALKKNNSKKQQKVITIGGKQYLPIKNKNIKPIKVGNQTFIPVLVKEVKSKNPQSKGKKNQAVIKIGKIQYVPSKNHAPIQIKGITYIPVEVKTPKAKCEKQVPIKTKQVIKIKGTILIPAPPIVIAGHTYIPFTTNSNKTINSKQIIKQLKKQIKIGDQTFKVNKKAKTITINGVHYIPVSIEKWPNLKKKSSKPVKKEVKKAIKNITKKPKQAKKCDKQIPIKSKSSIKIKGVNFVPSAPKVISGHTYIPFITKSNKKIDTKDILKQLKKSIKVGDSTFKVNKQIKTIVINGVHYIPVTFVKKQSKQVAIKKQAKKIPLKNQVKVSENTRKKALKPKKINKVIKQKIVVNKRKNKPVKKDQKKKLAKKDSCNGYSPVPCKKFDTTNDGIKKSIYAKKKKGTKKSLNEIKNPTIKQNITSLIQQNQTQDSHSQQKTKIIEEIEKVNKKQKLQIKKQKLLFIGNLFSKFFTLGKKKYFEKPYTFHFVQLKIVNDKPKITIVQSAKGRSLKQVLRLFRFQIKNKFINSHEQFGIIGNNQLIFSTSPFRKLYESNNEDLQKLVKYNSNGKEYLNDNISKLFVGYGFYKQIISLPKNVVKGNSSYLIRINPKSLKGETINVKSGSAQKEFEKNAKDKSKIYFLFNSKGKLINTSQKNFKSFVTLVSFLQKFGNFNGVILNENKLNIAFRKGSPNNFHKKAKLTFSPRTKRSVKSAKQNKQVEKKSKNPCKKFKDGSKRQQVCKLNNQYRGSKQPIRLSRKYNFGAVVYDPIHKSMSKVADNLNSNMRRGLKYVKWNLLKKYVEQPTQFQFLVFSENGPLTCSNKKDSKECQKMLGYSLTQGWWKPNKNFIDSSVDNQFYVIVRNEKSKKIDFSNVGCNKKEAIAKLKSLTKKGSIGAVLNSNAEIVEMTVTNPKNKGDMQFEEIYAMIGQYHLKDLQLFKNTPKSEKEAGLV